MSRISRAENNCSQFGPKTLSLESVICGFVAVSMQLSGQSTLAVATYSTIAPAGWSCVVAGHAHKQKRQVTGSIWSASLHCRMTDDKLATFGEQGEGKHTGPLDGGEAPKDWFSPASGGDGKGGASRDGGGCCCLGVCATFCRRFQ